MMGRYKENQKDWIKTKTNRMNERDEERQKDRQKERQKEWMKKLKG